MICFTVSLKENFEIVRLAEGDVRLRSDHWHNLKHLLLENEPMYPEIERWIQGKVQPGIRGDERVAFIGYSDHKPVVSAVLRKGNDAKVCHLKIAPELQNQNIGEVFWTIMMLEIRDLAKSVHFTLPETLWKEKAGFFKSFGFEASVVAEEQYRLFDRELASSSEFTRVWQHTIERIPKLANYYDLGLSLDNQLLFSIKPEYVQRIFTGKKTIEIRRRFSTAWLGSKINIYASAPVMRLVGEATVGSIVRDSPNAIWSRFEPNIGCSKAEFDTYTNAADEVYAIELRNPQKFRHQLPLNELSKLVKDHLIAPQSYLTLEKNKSWAKAISLVTYLRNCVSSPLSFVNAVKPRTRKHNPFSVPNLPTEPSVF
jgi:predicted transcriptional regulator